MKSVFWNPYNGHVIACPLGRDLYTLVSLTDNSQTRLTINAVEKKSQVFYYLLQ